MCASTASSSWCCCCRGLYWSGRACEIASYFPRYFCALPGGRSGSRASEIFDRALYLALHEPPNDAMTTTAMLLLLSAGLIAAGVALVWREVQRGRRGAFLAGGNRAAGATVDPQLEVTVAHGGTEPAGRGPAASAGGAPQWAALEPVIDQAVERVNGVLAAAGVEIGAPGEPSWSITRRYGAYR